MLIFTKSKVVYDSFILLKSLSLQISILFHTYIQRFLLIKWFPPIYHNNFNTVYLYFKQDGLLKSIKWNIKSESIIYYNVDLKGSINYIGNLDINPIVSTNIHL